MSHPEANPTAREAESKIYQWLEWMLPDLRYRRVQTDTRRWATLWDSFRVDGTMTRNAFIQVMIELGCPFSTVEVFEAMHAKNESFIRSSIVLQLKRKYEKTLTSLSLSPLENFKRFLVGQYRTLTCAWRVLLDPELRGCCGRSQFYKGCNHVGYSGDLRSTWDLLVGRQIHRPAVMEDLDPDVVKMMTCFSNALAKYSSEAGREGTPQEGWSITFHRCGGLRRQVTPKSFHFLCSGLNFTSNFAQQLYLAVDYNRKGFLGMEDWDFIWKCVYGSATFKARARRGVDGPEQVIDPLLHYGKIQSSTTSEFEDALRDTIEFRVFLTEPEYEEYSKSIAKKKKSSTNSITQKTHLRRKCLTDILSPRNLNRKSDFQVNGNAC